VAEGQAPRKAIVTAELLNVRSSPEADSDIVTHLKAGDPVEVIMTMPNWAFVNYRPASQDTSLTGWVNSRYVGSQEMKSTLMAQPEMAAAEVAAAEVPAAATPVAPPQTEKAIENTVAQQVTNPTVPETAPETTIEQIVVNVTPEPGVTPAAATQPSPAPAAEIAEDSLIEEPVDEGKLPEPTEPESVVTVPAAIAAPPAAITATNEAVSASVDAPLATQPDTANAPKVFEDVTQKMEAICEPGTQAQENPQGGASCIGVASLSADN
jgi:hypothetical protein